MLWQHISTPAFVSPGGQHCCSLTFQVVGVSGAYPPHGPRDKDDVVDIHVVAEELGALALRLLHTCKTEHRTKTVNWSMCVSTSVGVHVHHTVIPHQDDVDTAVQLHLFKTIHQLTDDSVDHPQRVVQLKHTRHEVSDVHSKCSHAHRRVGHSRLCSWGPFCVRTCPVVRSAWHIHTA